MKTHLSWLAATVLTLGTVTACGGDGDGDLDAFCGAYDQLNQQGGDVLTAEAGLEQIDTLAESAPQDIAADVEVAQEGYHAVTDAVEDAGLPLTVLDDSSNLSDEDQQTLTTAMEEADYDQAAVEEAFANIRTYAEDTCPA